MTSEGKLIARGQAAKYGVKTVCRVVFRNWLTL